MFAGGAVVGAAATALVVMVAAALLSPVPATVRYGLAVVLGVAVVLIDREVGRWRLPQSRRQIPPEVVAARRPASVWRFALVYGTGTFTFLPNAAPHVVVIWLALLASSPTILLAGVAFGLGRGLPLLVRAVLTDRDRYQRALERTATTMRPIVAPALLLLCAVVGWGVR